MDRPKPKTHVVSGEPMFAYYEVREVNEYLAAKDVEMAVKDKEILALKRANQALRASVAGTAVENKFSDSLDTDSVVG